jgi:hypothetical protein
MTLSSDLISQFVKATNDNKTSTEPTTTYGTTVTVNGKKYVRLDGADEGVLTPISTTADTIDNERVIVSIKNHIATIMGNVSSPSARTDDVDSATKLASDAASKVSEFDFIFAHESNILRLDVLYANVDTLVADNILINNQIAAYEGEFTELAAENVRINEHLIANSASIQSLSSTKLDVLVAEANYASITDLQAATASIRDLNADFADIVVLNNQKFTAIEGDIASLQADKLSVSDASITYANIDFSNIGKAAMEYFYANSGLIDNVTVDNGVITGKLVGVTLSGDLIEGNTIVAEKLVIKGDDGIYYKLNTDGITTSSEQTDYNSLNGQVIKAKSVTAEKISVSDLVAFDATIGGFNITDSAIYSEVKDSENNVTRGIYMDKEGQFNVGDENNFIKYYRTDDGSYKLSVSAESIIYSLNGKQYSISDLGTIGDYVHIGTYEGEPCIELGESDSNFKLIITNTRIMFMENSDVPAYINNQSLNIKKAVIEEELQQGNFVWRIRDNGNMGLVWKGD